MSVRENLNGAALDIRAAGKRFGPRTVLDGLNLLGRLRGRSRRPCYRRSCVGATLKGGLGQILLCKILFVPVLPVGLLRVLAGAGAGRVGFGSARRRGGKWRDC